MKIKEEKRDDIIICSLEGEININTSLELRKVFDKFINNNEKKIIIDFSCINYIDSSGLATLIEMLQKLKKIGGNLYLVNLSDRIKNIFEVTKLIKLFSIFDNKDLAIESLKKI